MMKKVKTMSAVVILALCSCLFFACGKSGAGPKNASDFSGCWKSNVIGAEYIELLKDGTYQTYDSEGASRFSGSFIIDGIYAVLDGTDKEDESAFMVLEYIDKNTLHYDGSLSEYTYTKTEGIPKEENTGNDTIYDMDIWYGIFKNASGKADITESILDNTVSYEISLSNGSSLSGTLTVYSSNQAKDEYINIFIEDDIITIEALDNENENFSGIYIKESI